MYICCFKHHNVSQCIGSPRGKAVTIQNAWCGIFSWVPLSVSGICWDEKSTSRHAAISSELDRPIPYSWRGEKGAARPGTFKISESCELRGLNTASVLGLKLQSISVARLLVVNKKQKSSQQFVCCLLPAMKMGSYPLMVLSTLRQQ